MTDIKVRITGIVDRASMLAPFAALGQAAERANARATGSARRSAKESTEAIKAGLRDQAAAAGSAYRASARQFEASEAEKDRIAAKHEQIRARIRDATFRRMQADSQREERATLARRQREERVEANQRRGFGREVVSNMRRGAGYAYDVGKGVAAGAGIDWSPQTLVGRHVRTEEKVIGTVAQSAMGKGQKATSQDVADAMAAVRDAATDARQPMESMADALDAFVGKASDAKLGAKLLKELGTVANATGAELGDVATIAGIVAANIDDADPDKY